MFVMRILRDIIMEIRCINEVGTIYIVYIYIPYMYIYSTNLINTPYFHYKVTILWNQQVQSDRTIPNNKPDIIG